MTIDEAMARASAAIDDAITNAMDEGIRLVTDRGATPKEIESFVEWYGRQLAADRATKLADLRGWLSRGGESLQ